MQNLWSAHDQILLFILLKEFINLNVNTDTMIKKCETKLNADIKYGIKYKDCYCFVEYTSFKDNRIQNVSIVTRIIKKSLMKI